MVTTLKIDETESLEAEKTYCCKKCNAPFDERTRRSFFVRTFLFWLPLRHYACYKCKREYYVFR